MSVVKYKDQNGEWKPISSVNGVGIANIEQTTVSQEAGGENIIKFTLTNGKEFEGVLHNGNDGKDYVLTDADKEEIAEMAAEAIGAEEKVLLWENASPNSAQIGQYIQLGDVSAYSAFVVVCKGREFRFLAGGWGVVQTVSAGENYYDILYRECSFSSPGKLSIGDGYSVDISADGAEFNSSNYYAVITAVYGVKGA